MSLWRSRRRTQHEQNPAFQPSGRREAKSRSKRRTSRYEQFEPRRLLAVSPRLVSIIPNEGELLVDGQTRDVAPRELTFRFSEGQIINPSTLGGIQIVRSNFDGVLGDGDDILITPGYIGIGDRTNEVVVRFADALPDDLYQIRIVGTGSGALRNTEGDAFNNGVDVTVRFEMDLGAQVIAVVPQPVTRLANGGLSQARNQIEVYFNNDDLSVASATNRNFYQLIFTNSTGNNQDDQVFLPNSVTYDAASDKAVLTFANDIALLGAGQGAYRLRIGNADSIPTAPSVLETAVDQGATFTSAQNLGPLSNQSKIIKAAVDPQLFRLELPGDIGEPGHRDVPAQLHYLAERAPDSTVGITTAFYNFKSIYGTDLLGNPAFNVITESQKQRVREVFSLYSYYAGIQFIESDSAGMTIVTGDPRILDPTIEAGPGGVLGVAGGGLTGTAVIDAVEPWGASEFGGDYFTVVMHEIGHLLGLGHADELAPLTVMSGIYDNSIDFEKVFPGDQDIVHLRHKFRPEAKDIDVYRFSVPSVGTITAETFAERLNNGSGLDSLVSIYDSTGKLVARNDDYFGNDSLTQVEVVAGDYFVVVSSTGNNEYNLTVEDSGFEGTTQGSYELRLDFTPKPVSGMVDSTGTLFDGDADGTPGGAYNFWFQVATAENTVFVDKAATSTSGPLGSIGNPYRTLREAIDPAQANSARAGDVLRVVGNGGTDGNVATLADNAAYEVGFNSLGNALADGTTLRVPKGVSMVVDAGAIFKLRRANIEVGSASLNVDRSLSSMQVLGTPTQSVYFTSYQNEQVGRDTFTPPTSPDEGDWGGLVFRNIFDKDAERTVLEDEGIFLNYVNHATITYGGGDVLFDSRQTTFSPIHMEKSRPTITYNTISLSADSAMSADPDSFADTRFNSELYTADYDRVGPEIQANRLQGNTINGLFVRIATETLSNQPLDKLTVPGRFDDTDIVHVVSENLLIRGGSGGRQLFVNEETGQETILSRPEARLKIDAGIVVKLDGAHIETEIGADFIAEGKARNRIIFTSLSDDRFGGSGSFDTGGEDPNALPEPGDWGGLYFGPTSDASIDHALITYAGGINAIDGDFAGFNAIEIHQAKARITNSVLELNDDGFGGAERVGKTENGEAVIYVSGAQPILVNNIIRDNSGPAVNVNVNALNSTHTKDWGRSTGAIDIFTGVVNNFGPLVRGNLLANNSINGMQVRGSTLTTQSVWDDTDITHVLFDTVSVDNHHTFSGLRLQSNANESLVVKLQGDEAGFTATGLALEIDDRIGGSVYVLGTPGHPVVLTSVADDTVGAGLDPDGNVIFDTNNDGILSSPAAGDWRSVRLDTYSNDRNVEVVNEVEASVGAGTNVNGAPESAQPLGELATAELTGDDNRRLGFEIHGFLNSVAPGDVDVYSFRAMAGTVVWIDIDRTAYALDTVVELIDSDGTVLARSDNSFDEFQTPSKLVGAANLLQTDVFKSRDQYGTNPRDAGMRVVLPGAVSNVPKTYFVRVRARGANIDNLTSGTSMGEYQMQIRLRELDEVPGSTVRYADIRNSTNGIEVIGLPTRSPFLGDRAEDLTLPNGTRAEAQDLGNLLASDLGVISVAGSLDDPDGLLVDWYELQVSYALTQSNGGFLGVVFDIDYADGLARADTSIAVFDEEGNLILVARDSDLTDDQPSAAAGATGDLTAGSYGKADPYIGPYDIPVDPLRTYYVAVFSNKTEPSVLDATFLETPTNPLVRLEPLATVKRIAEDRVDSDGGTEPDGPAFDIFPAQLDPRDPRSDLFPPGGQTLNFAANVFTLADVTTYINTSGELFTVDPYSGVIETDVTQNGGNTLLPDVLTGTAYHDFAMRNDGRLFTLTQTDQADSGGNLREINWSDGTSVSSDDDELELFHFVEDEEGETALEAVDVPLLYEAMTFQPGSIRARTLYAVGHMPRDPEPHESEDWEEPCFDNLLYRIAGDDQFPTVPLGRVIDLPDDAGEREPSNAINRGCLNTETDGPGGFITGIAFVGQDMFAVTDTGGLFQVVDPDSDEATLEFISTITFDHDDNPGTPQIPLEFSGLTIGPPNAENGVYEEVLFATTSDGLIVTLNNEGDLLPLLRDGKAVVDTGVQGLRGITFSNIDYNLWHVTDARGTEAGHGIDGQLGASVTRPEQQGATSYYFGLENPLLGTTISNQPNAAAYQFTNNRPQSDADPYGEVWGTYNTPGGAHGSLTTEPFSLADYTANDKPTLYFNYLLETEGAASTHADYTLMRDALRVWGTSDGVNWIPLTTNNSLRSNGLAQLGELPEELTVSGGDYRNDLWPNQRVQETYDTVAWRQARVDLGDLASSAHVQLRFDFSTGAQMDFGMDPNRAIFAAASESGTGGVSLAASEGAKLRDGDLFTLQALIDGEEVVHPFEFDSGHTLVIPVDGGKRIQDGERFTISVGSENFNQDFIFEFDRDGNVPNGVFAVPVKDVWSAAEVAQSIWQAISDVYAAEGFQNPDNQFDTLVYLNGNRVNLGFGFDGDIVFVDSQSANPVVQLVGSMPGEVTQPGATPVPVNEGMTDDEVALQMAHAIDAGIAEDREGLLPVDDPAFADFSVVAKADRQVVKIFGWEVGQTAGLAYSDLLPGDMKFGDFSNLTGANQLNTRAQNNSFEGVYLDDFVIGFAERGETVVHADAFDTFFEIPEPSVVAVEQPVVGPYQLEVRTGATLTVSSGGAAVQYESIDTNDRFAEGMALIFPAGAFIRDGATFELSDGTRSATFEFDGLANGVRSGNVRIIFDGTETPGEIATEVRKAINGQTKIKVTADTIPSLAPAAATSARVQLYGAIGRDGTGSLDLEPNDTLASATPSGLSSDTQGIWARTGYLGDSGGINDVDMISIDLIEGDAALIDIDVNRDSSAAGLSVGEQVSAVIRVFDEDGNELDSNFVNLLFPPVIGVAPNEYASYDPSLRFVAPFTGRFYIGISSNGVSARNDNYDPEIERSGAGEFVGPYSISIAIGGSNVIGSHVYDDTFGDTNPERQQGQIILQGNRITDALEYGIRVDADDRTAGDRPHPGAPLNTPALNTNRWAPGITIENNIIDGPTQGGIFFSGDARPDAAILLGRIINNTIYGRDQELTGIGITVSENTSPTMINNIVSNFETGISVDATSQTTVIGGTVYKGNSVNTVGTGVGSFALLLDPLTPSDPEQPLFIDAPNGNFYLAPNSKAIDSSINVLQDRPYMVSIGSPLGIAPSPILAPERDAFGQLRVNDPDVPSPPGLGSNVFKDRGALDRADFSGPSAVLIVPEDNAAAGGDLDPNPNSVLFVAQTVTRFAIQLADGVLPADPQAGAGVDDATVTASKFQLRRNGVLLTLGVDYFFAYDSLNNVARLTAAEGIWTPGNYTINVNNTLAGGIRDVAGNVLKSNNLAGATEFTVRLATADFGDAPPQYPTTVAQQGAVHVLGGGLFLGSAVSPDDDGQPSSDAIGDTDDGVQFGGPLFGGQSTTISVRASAAGRLDAWIDFNGDGDWNDAGEQIFASRAVSAGLNTLTFAVPASAVTGESFARFRLSTSGGLTPGGLANDGEVEDYRVEVAPPIAYSVVLTSVNGQELAKDLDGRYGVGKGSEVVIQVYVDDQRSLATGGGVQAAFADLVASTSTIEFVAGSLTYGPTFVNSFAGTITAGEVNEAGGVGANPPGTDRQLLFTVRGKVKTDAANGAVVDLSLNPADDASHTTRFYGSPSAIPPSFGQASVIVLANPYQNPGNRFDVNSDGVVSGLDALILINRINANGGPLVLPIPVTNAQPPYLDPNGDNSLTALDVLQVINEINRRAASTQSLMASAGTDDFPGLPTYDFETIAASIGSNGGAPAYAGAFLPTTLSPALVATKFDDAADVFFAESNDDEADYVSDSLADDVWSDDEFSAEIAVARPRGKADSQDELASLWNQGTQDWTTATGETIVEKRNAKRWS